jgi:hypothetical protein
VDAQRKLPMLATALVAVVGTALILFNSFNPDREEPRDAEHVVEMTMRQ